MPKKKFHYPTHALRTKKVPHYESNAALKSAIKTALSEKLTM
jgi:hypothetical protein